MTTQDEETFSGQGNDLFHALQNVRRTLDAREVLLRCNGARANARPSGAVSERGAELVYLVPRRRPVSTLDVVPLFAPAENTVSVDEQEETWKAIVSSRTRLLWPVNPVWWWRRLLEAVNGPVIWVPETDAKGFTTWHVTPGRNRMHKRTRTG
ncbi:hypothetical protein [Streptomyces asoensis]|uniref:hypothetical protein n=1 Tax=Streptomyces asoensis TaxID=249586 RepID=UPI0033C66CEA